MAMTVNKNSTGPIGVDSSHGSFSSTSVQNKVNSEPKSAPTKNPQVSSFAKTETIVFEETPKSGETKTKRTFLEWLSDGIQSIKDFFSSMFKSGKGDAKSVAQEGGEIVKTHQEKTGEVNKAKVEERKEIVQPKAKSILDGNDAVAKINTATANSKGFDTLVSKLVEDIATRQQDKKHNPDDLDPTAFRDKVFGTILQQSTELAMDSIDVTKLRQHAERLGNEGKGAEADLVRAYADKVEYARTPDGAKELFEDLAKNAMREQKPDTFLRGTANEGVAAVKKLVQANGGAEFKNKVIEATKPLMQSPEFKQLMSDLKEAGIANLSNSPKQGMTKEMADRLGDFALKMMDAISKVDVPEGAKEVLKMLGSEIGKRDDFQQHGSEMMSRLYSDQLFLKQVGKGLTADLNAMVPKDIELPPPSFTNPKKSQAKVEPEKSDTSTAPKNQPVKEKTINSPFFVSGDMINVVANGVRDQVKYQSLEARDMFMKIGPKILEKQGQIFEKAGLDKSHMDKTWPDSELLEFAHGIRNGLQTVEDDVQTKKLDQKIEQEQAKLDKKHGPGQVKVSITHFGKTDAKAFADLGRKVVGILSDVKFNKEMAEKMEGAEKNVLTNANFKGSETDIRTNFLVNAIMERITMEGGESLSLISSDLLKAAIYLPGTGEDPSANWSTDLKQIVADLRNDLQREVLSFLNKNSV